MISKLIILKEQDLIQFFYRLNKLAAEYDRDLTPYEIDKCRKDTHVFDGEDGIGKALHCLLKFTGDERNIKNKSVEKTLHLHAHNGLGFDTWKSSSNLPCDKRNNDIKKNGKGIVS